MIYKKPSGQIRKLNYLLFTLIFLSAILFTACAEQVKEEVEEIGGEGSEIVTDEKVKELDQMPLFVGGVDSLYQFMSEHINYPEDAKKKGVSGTVYVSFVINENGEVTTAKVESEVYPSLDEEALRVINSMPNWTPGKKGNKLVSVQLVLPISFKLPARSSGYEIIYRETDNGDLVLDSIKTE